MTNAHVHVHHLNQRNPRAARPRRPRANAGFLLNELLIAIGIFAIGMAALASLFPVAGLLQRETIREVEAATAAQAARAIVDAKQMTFSPETGGNPPSGDLAGYHARAGGLNKDVVPLHQINPDLLRFVFPPEVRAYPTSQLDNRNTADCDLFWVPFIQDLNGTPTGSQNWVMRVFILEREASATYTRPANAATAANPNDPDNFPKVVSLPCSVADRTVFSVGGAHTIQPGDVVMDSNGIDYVVAAVQGNNITVAGNIPTSPSEPRTLWVAPRYNGVASPARRVVTINIQVPPAF